MKTEIKKVIVKRVKESFINGFEFDIHFISNGKNLKDVKNFCMETVKEKFYELQNLQMFHSSVIWNENDKELLEDVFDLLLEFRLHKIVKKLKKDNKDDSFEFLRDSLIKDYEFRFLTEVREDKLSELLN